MTFRTGSNGSGLGATLTMIGSLANHALEADRGSSWPRCARNELRARQRGIAAWPAAQLGR
jgi:hypothetical protein